MLRAALSTLKPSYERNLSHSLVTDLHDTDKICTKGLNYYLVRYINMLRYCHMKRFYWTDLLQIALAHKKIMLLKIMTQIQLICNCKT